MKKLDNPDALGSASFTHFTLAPIMNYRRLIIFYVLSILIQLLFLAPVDAQELNANEVLSIRSYKSTLQELVPILTEHRYSSNYAVSVRENNLSYCSPKNFCDEKNISKLLLFIQNEKFTLIPPIFLTKNGRDMLAAIRSQTSCKNLGFMNIKRYPGFSYNEAVPLRPTEGLGIYQLPVQAKNILLVRGEEYQPAWSFWGADLSGPKLPIVPPEFKSTGVDFLFELDSQSCSVISRFNLKGLHQSVLGHVKELSFSEPILIGKDIFILALGSTQLPQQPPVFGIWLI